MLLSSYLRKMKESDAAFGQRVGVRRNKVWSYRTGRATPSAKTASKIVEATGGAVTLDDLIRAPRNKAA